MSDGKFCVSPDCPPNLSPNDSNAGQAAFVARPAVRHSFFIASVLIDDRSDSVEGTSQLTHLPEDRKNDSRRAERRLAAGPREVINTELQHLVAKPSRSDDEFRIDERAFALQLDVIEDLPLLHISDPTRPS